MENDMKVNRNIILDLLPAYLAGEASEETKTLVESFAKTDEEIRLMIDNVELVPELKSQETIMLDNLEMKTIERVQNSIRRKMIYVALLTASILLIPLVAMQYSSEVNWDLMDFVIMGMILFSIGGAFVFLPKISGEKPFLIGAGIALFAMFLLIWVNLAVGIIGSSGGVANLLFFGVILIGLATSIKDKFTPAGLSKAMLYTAIAQLTVPFIALIFWRSSMEMPPGILAIFGMNAFFALLFGLSSFLFKSAAKDR